MRKVFKVQKLRNTFRKMSERMRIGVELRQVITQLIAAERRPLCVSEIKNLMKIHNEEFWNRAVSPKCADYIRVIVSSSSDCYVKYQSKEVHKGIDRRSIFYGLPNVKYDSNWIPVADQSRTPNILLDETPIPNLVDDYVTVCATTTLQQPPVIDSGVNSAMQQNKTPSHLYEKEGNWMEWKKLSLNYQNT